MKYLFSFLTMILAGGLLFSAESTDVARLKLDLIGHTMGGREKSWKFQSPEQIKKLLIKSKTEDTQKRVFIVSMKLQATNSAAQYNAEARVEYTNIGGVFGIKHVGLLSLSKAE